MLRKIDKPNKVLLFMGLSALILSSVFCTLFETPEDVQLFAEAPSAVRKGERFEIFARVINMASETQVLIDLDVADEYLEGVVIESSRPMFWDAYHVPVDDTISYSYDIDIAPGEEVWVVFEAYAAKVGDYAGDIDFCINSEVTCLSYRIRTIIE